MHSFKKALGAGVAFVLCVIILSICIIEPYYIRKPYYYQDSEVRESMSGTIDYLFCGASHALHAINPVVIDEELGTNSYNLSSSFMTMQGKYELISKELARNPVSTLIMELSYSSFTRNRDTEGPEGDIYLLGRLENPLERIKYFFSAMRTSDYVSVYYYTLSYGIASIGGIINGPVDTSPRYANKGFSPLESTDLTVSEDEYVSMYNTQSFDNEIFEENVMYLNKVIELCREKNTRLILIVTPLSKELICQYDNLDTSRKWYEEIAGKNGIEFYDFNLLNNKDELFLK